MRGVSRTIVMKKSDEISVLDRPHYEMSLHLLNSTEETGFDELQQNYEVMVK